MPHTRKRHFDEDISRAKNILAHAIALPHRQRAKMLLREDLFRSAWMFAVGAMDAYFSDAYTDVIASTLIAKSRERSVTLPAFVSDIAIPVTAILAPYAQRHNWRWRMAARCLMESENMLKLGRVAESFNPFFSNGQKLWHQVVDQWIAEPGATARVFGITPGQYLRLAAQARTSQRSKCADALVLRFGGIIKRRHDCIHNCDRPRVSPQRIETPGTVANIIRDITFLIERFDAHLIRQVHRFLSDTGFSATTIASTGY